MGYAPHSDDNLLSTTNILTYDNDQSMTSKRIPENTQKNTYPMNPIRQQWEERYTQPSLPWDSGITPPEVVDFWQSDRSIQQRDHQVALDMGCGTGTNVAYLASLGLRAIGVELSGNGLEIAETRLSQLPLGERQRISLVQASVAQVPFQNLGCGYILDIGCLHTIPTDLRPDYAAGMLANLASGGYYHLYGFDKLDPTDESVQRGLGENEVVELLGSHVDIISIEQANPAPNPCRWYLFRKK